MDLRETGSKDLDLIHLDQDRYRWLAFLKIVTVLRVA